MQQNLIRQQTIYSFIFIVWCLFACLAPASSFAATTVTPLPAEEAFSFTATVNKPNEVVVEWRIAPGYYLYSKRLHVTFTPATQADVRIPQGDLKYSSNGKADEVFSGLLTVLVRLPHANQAVQMQIDYQGCSSEGFCYPPMQKNLQLSAAGGAGLTLINAAEPASMQVLLTNQQSVQSILQTQSLGMTLMLFLGIGLLLAFTPCVLPMVPILTSIIVGQKKANTKQAFFLSTSYVFGTAITYAIAGIIVAMMGSSLQVWLQKPWVISSVAALFVLLALSLFGLYTLRLPNKLQQHIISLSNKQQRGTYLGVFLMGMISTLIVSPCVTAPLVGVLMFIAETGNTLLGASALFVMGLGMGLPLIAIGMSAGKWLPKTGPWMEAVKHLFGVFMLAMAIWMLSRILSANTTMILYGALLIGIGLFFIVTLPSLLGARKISRVLGSALGALGLVTIISVANPFDITGKLYAIKSPVLTANQFIVIHTISEFNKQLLIAQTMKRPVLLDFYADWCESCVSMEKKVFDRFNVQKSLSDYVLLRADLSANTSDDEAMLKYFKVIAPPTILFFKPNGAELSARRIIGEVSDQEFLSRLSSINSN